MRKHLKKTIPIALAFILTACDQPTSFVNQGISGDASLETINDQGQNGSNNYNSPNDSESSNSSSSSTGGSGSTSSGSGSGSTSGGSTQISSNGSDIDVTITTNDTSSFSPATNDEKLACAQALHVTIAQIVDIGAKATAQITADTVLIAVISGNAQINLNEIQTNLMTGMCIIAKGKADIAVKTTVTFQSLYYEGQGTSSGGFEFNASSSLDTLSQAILGGNSMLSLKGEALKCQSIQNSVGNAANFDCIN